jgi:hypothetical protein
MDELKKDEQKRNQAMSAGKPGNNDKTHGDKKMAEDTKLVG